MKGQIYCMIVIALCVGTVFSQQREQSSGANQHQRMSKIERKIARHGGMVELAPTGAIIRVVSAQTKICKTDMDAAFDVFRQAVRVPVEWTMDASGSQDPARIAHAANADGKCGVAIVLIDDPTAERILIAPENGWASINMAKLAEGASSRDLLIRRARQEYWRTVCMILGAYVAPIQPCLLTMIADNKGLDNNPCVIPAVEAIPKAIAGAKKLGIMPGRRVLYEHACQQGWAPAPTNDIQKAIWDKVHQLPTKPIKIEPEKKPVKE